jgi:putative hydrolase of the HAD superfamily
MKLDWSQIDTVLLDMDGVLLDLHYDNHFWQHHVLQVYANKHDMSYRDVKRQFAPIFAAHAGTLNWYCVDFWSEQFGIDIMLHKAEMAEKIGFRPTAEAFLQNCQQQVDDLRLITNGHRKVLELKIEKTSLDQYFKQMICSHELGAAKESQVFWQQLHRSKGFDPDRTLFIDDSESVLDSAKRYGIGHLYSIAKPDSKKDRATISKFPMLEVLPS